MLTTLDRARPTLDAQRLLISGASETLRFAARAFNHNSSGRSTQHVRSGLRQSVKDVRPVAVRRWRTLRSSDKHSGTDPRTRCAPWVAGPPWAGYGCGTLRHQAGLAQIVGTRFRHDFTEVVLGVPAAVAEAASKLLAGRVFNSLRLAGRRGREAVVGRRRVWHFAAAPSSRREF